jgi:hypothetical protein
MEIYRCTGRKVEVNGKIVKCSGTLRVNPTGNIRVQNPTHICTNAVTSTVPDVSEEMRLLVKDLVLDKSNTSKSISDRVLAEINEKYEDWKGLSASQVLNLAGSLKKGKTVTMEVFLSYFNVKGLIERSNRVPFRWTAVRRGERDITGPVWKWHMEADYIEQSST